ncbi:CIA30 family protein [Nonlabens antarcticus]|uniref:CIA30 family protein n=1 Tax=Nonlabens antarcticus TaxID=392714 RepID=UPI00189178B6|nr:CIA30 family protein [Nonlabens antarcticus]
MHISKPKEIFFGESNTNLVWIPFTDQVIGGNSKGEVLQHEAHLEFTGSVDNVVKGRGWAGLRSRKEAHDLSDYKFIELKIKTDGLPYQFQLEHDMAWQNDKLSTTIDIVSNQWKVMHLEMADFKIFNAHKNDITRKPKIELLKCIYRYNILAARENNRGFNFQIEYIKFH